MYTGLTGRLRIRRLNSTGDIAPNLPADDIAFISNWNVETSVEVIEAASLGQPTRRKKAGLRNWTASADGTICFAATTPVSGHQRLFDAMNNGDEVRCEFFLDIGAVAVPSVSAARDQVRFVGNGIIESLSIDLSAEDKGNISISINGSGPLALERGPVTPPTGG